MGRIWDDRLVQVSDRDLDPAFGAGDRPQIFQVPVATNLYRRTLRQHPRRRPFQPFVEFQGKATKFRQNGRSPFDWPISAPGFIGPHHTGVPRSQIIGRETRGSARRAQVRASSPPDETKLGAGDLLVLLQSLDRRHQVRAETTLVQASVSARRNDVRQH
jgi:hypothetical protein